MKALMLAAVMALGGTGASALDSYTLLTKGVILATAGGGSRAVWISYKDAIYSCRKGSSEYRVVCFKVSNETVSE